MSSETSVVQPKSRGNNSIGHDCWDVKAAVFLSCWRQSSCRLLLEFCLNLFLIPALLRAELAWVCQAPWTCSLEVKNQESVTRHLWDAVHIFWRTLDKWLIFLSNSLRQLHWRVIYMNLVRCLSCSKSSENNDCLCHYSFIQYEWWTAHS